MNNSIIATIKFSFKGETYTPSGSIDLDLFLEKGKDLSSIHSLIARNGDIDTYSYAYEVMQASDVSYSRATGLAEKYLLDGVFDFAGFSRDWLDQKNLQLIKDIAEEYMDINDLGQHPKLQNALLEALNKGRETA